MAVGVGSAVGDVVFTVVALGEECNDVQPAVSSTAFRGKSPRRDSVR